MIAFLLKSADFYINIKNMRIKFKIRKINILNIKFPFIINLNYLFSRQKILTTKLYKFIFKKLINKIKTMIHLTNYTI